MKFYYINSSYLKYLRTFEPKIMESNDSEGYEKFVFGILLKIEDVNYYAPVSSIKDYQINESGNVISALSRRVFPIVVEDKILALVRLDFMLPIKDNDLKRVDIDSLETKHDLQYKNLVLKEHLFCKKNKTEISLKAIKIYEKSLKPTHYFNKCCCNFKVLNEKCMEWEK